jgi:hypothetical protein
MTSHGFAGDSRREKQDELLTSFLYLDDAFTAIVEGRRIGSIERQNTSVNDCAITECVRAGRGATDP